MNTYISTLYPVSHTLDTGEVVDVIYIDSIQSRDCGDDLILNNYLYKF